MAKANILHNEFTDKKFLNVGGGSKDTIIPEQYNGWKHILLDIDESVAPDIVCDARKLGTLPAGEFDAIYCSHNLEHYLRHDALKVLQGFLHVLKDDGFAHIRVPDIQEVMKKVVTSNLDIGDILYNSAVGSISVRDVIYGYEKQIEETGQDYYAHKTGFSPQSLKDFMHQAGFPIVGVGANSDCYEITAFGFKQAPNEEVKRLFNING